MSNNLSAGRLTRFSSASVAEVFSISFPLMLASLSGLLMNFGDRIILARFSTDAMNAAVTAGMAANIFTMGMVSIAVIAEVFVGKQNGARAFHLTSPPVWQMIWFSFATVVILLPIGLSLSDYLVPADQFDGMAVPYFKIWMYFGCFFPMAGALSAFFIGIGAVKIVTFATLSANAVNLVLDYIFVFGINGLLEPMGTTGAALATGIAEMMQVVILATAFLSKSNRMRYHTANCQFDWQLFRACLKLGAPSAIGQMIEIAAWALILRLMAQRGPNHITSLTVGQNLTILFAFMSQGLQKGVLAVAANLIGAGRHDKIKTLIRSTGLMIAAIMVTLFVPIVIYPNPIVALFFGADADNAIEFIQVMRSSGIFVWLFIVLDTVVWSIAGILTAYGETKFIMLTNATTAWLCAVMPAALFVKMFSWPPLSVWVIFTIYGATNATMFSLRLYGKRMHLV